MLDGLISIIVTTYNREDALDAVLRSLAGQSDREFEVVIADDGSERATGDLVERWQAKFGRRLDCVWHEDRGFRAAEIRNRAILASHGTYCIFLTATASRGRISSPRIVGWPNRAASSPAIAFCCRAS